MAALAFVLFSYARRTRELRISDARNRELLNQSPHGVYEISSDGVFVRANPALARMLGYAAPEHLLERSAEQNKKY